MKNGFPNTMKWMLAGALLAAPWMAKADTATKLEPTRVENKLAEKVRHELVMLPYYGVFDNLSFRVEEGTVTLHGQVNRPALKSDAGNVVKRIEGVRQVNNQIEVLPLSPFDDRVRLGVLRAVYGTAALQRYGMGAIPSIHIIVKNGEVTLEGVVGNQGDSNIANIRANGVSGVFKVHNNLRVENSKTKKG